MGDIYFFIPLVIGIFCLYFSYIQRKINDNYNSEYESKVQSLKDKGEDNEKVNEAWERLRYKYGKISNQQFFIFLLALSKCFVSYEDLIGVSILLYGLNKIIESYKMYKLDSKYKLRELIIKKEESSKIVGLKHQMKTKFLNTVVHCVFYISSQLQGY
ncbi:hypothetical protein BCR36DRAFT_296534 [Piromyces finnis]|uniref:Uncharacterized protein n=1 Tax=Piromyces finnis TaxID=1754191 RepID=A0A1Y1V432_9FUNG|nr:hypothetical protein BCR36DRAFT_296534 [Piromyces finnis]|eukprot:ORX46859.1 hypothetical protein BCR36DRAFT_296534 [Piromyces finnis]